MARQRARRQRIASIFQESFAGLPYPPPTIGRSLTPSRGADYTLVLHKMRVSGKEARSPFSKRKAIRRESASPSARAPMEHSQNRTGRPLFMSGTRRRIDRVNGQLMTSRKGSTRRFSYQPCHRGAPRHFLVACDSFIECLGNSLTVSCFLQFILVGRTAHEGDLG